MSAQEYEFCTEKDDFAWIHPPVKCCGSCCHHKDIDGDFFVVCELTGDMRVPYQECGMVGIGGENLISKATKTEAFVMEC